MSDKRRSEMDEKTYMSFYRETVSRYSRKAQRAVRDLLESKGAITFDEQQSIFQDRDAAYFGDKSNLEEIIAKTTTDRKFMKFYEYWEFVRMYKYSVPLFYETVDKDDFRGIFDGLSAKGISQKFNYDNFQPGQFLLRSQIKDDHPLLYEIDGRYFVKFVLQKSALINDADDVINYRYPVVVWIDPAYHILEIRYDALKYSDENGSVDYYPLVVDSVVRWLEEKLKLKLFLPDHADIIDKINDKNDDSVHMFKQMMQMKSGGSAELTASQGSDAVLPFIGELRELISENEELFDQNIGIKDLLIKYLDDKESTANYPYIYVKWVKPVESQSYVVRITFDYLNLKFTVLQHLTGTCSDMEMGRMNDAIEYLCKSGSFTKGEKV